MSTGNQKWRVRWHADSCAWIKLERDYQTGEFFLSDLQIAKCDMCGKEDYYRVDRARCCKCWGVVMNQRSEPKEHEAAQSRAHAAVHIAIRDGVLADLRHVEIKCTDCAARAVVYDHRDYRKPLDVQPVCRSCNTCRGPAIDIAHLVTRRFKRRVSQ